MMLSAAITFPLQFRSHEPLENSHITTHLNSPCLHFVSFLLLLHATIFTEVYNKL